MNNQKQHKRLKLLKVKNNLKQVVDLLSEICDIEHEGDNILNTLSSMTNAFYPFHLSLDEQVAEIEEYIEFIETLEMEV